MFEFFITTYGNQIIMLILCAIFGSLGFVLRKFVTEFINNDAKKAIAAAVVQFVEQAWKTIHGEEKLQKALETARVLLEKKGIEFDAVEMEVLIEAAVAEFNEVFRKPLDSTDKAAAVRRVETTE